MVDVEFNVEPVGQIDVDDVVEKLENEEFAQLTDEELRAFVRLLTMSDGFSPEDTREEIRDHVDEFAELVSESDEAREQKLRSDGLSWPVIRSVIDVYWLCSWFHREGRGDPRRSKQFSLIVFENCRWRNGSATRSGLTERRGKHGPFRRKLRSLGVSGFPNGVVESTKHGEVGQARGERAPQFAAIWSAWETLIVYGVNGNGMPLLTMAMGRWCHARPVHGGPVTGCNAMSDAESGMIEKFRDEIDPTVFLFGAVLTVGVIIAFFVSPNAVEAASRR